MLGTLLVRKNRFSQRTIKWTFIAGMLTIMSTLFLSGRENIFTVNGKVESATLTFAENRLNKWNITGASIITDLDNLEPELLQQQEVYFSPAKGATATVNFRIGTKRKEIFITVASEQGSIGVIESEDGSFTLGTYTEIIVPFEHSKIFPFVGSMQLGEDVAVGVENILLEGTVKIIEQEFIGDGRYVAGEYNLDRGDRVVLYLDNNLTRTSQVKGFMRLTDNNAIAITAHGVGEVVKVERLGSAGYKISPSVWARLTHDPLIAAITTLFATLLLLMEFSELIVNLSAKKEENITSEANE